MSSFGNKFSNNLSRFFSKGINILILIGILFLIYSLYQLALNPQDFIDGWNGRLQGREK